MIPRYLFDVNLLVALAVRDHLHHARAHTWLGTVRSFVTSPITEAGMVRVVTTRAAIGVDIPMASALRLVEDLRANPGHSFVPDDASFADPRISLERLTSPRGVTDLHLVDLAARHGLVLATLDRGIPQLLAEEDRRHVLVIP